MNFGHFWKVGKGFKMVTFKKVFFKKTFSVYLSQVTYAIIIKKYTHAQKCDCISYNMILYNVIYK